MAVCRKNLPLGTLSSRNAPSVLVGALFKKIGLFLNTPRICEVKHETQKRYEIQTLSGADTDSHNLRVAKIWARLKKIIRFQKGQPTRDLDKLYAQRQKVQDTLQKNPV